MEHEETYQGRRFVVTTTQAPNGTWSFSAATIDADQRVPLVAAGESTYDSEEEAWRAGVSAAAGAIDRTRTTRGKP
jgi:hypothetical protein